MLLVDLVRGRLVGDEEIKREVASHKPYAQWLEGNKIDLASLASATPASAPRVAATADDRRRLLRTFGLLARGPPHSARAHGDGRRRADGQHGHRRAARGAERTAPASLFRYFKQQFAQVTNPPIDPIREKLVMTLVSCLGGEGNLLAETPAAVPHARARAADPDERGARAASSAEPLPDFPVRVLPVLFDADPEASASYDPGAALERALVELCAAAERAVDGGASILVLSDRGVDAGARAHPEPARDERRAPLARARRQAHARRALVETGEAREVADVALLVGYGAGAVNPYLAFEAIDALELDIARATSARTTTSTRSTRACSR